ncbi:proline iminopeptidase [Niveomyces insectorum RCEF 264]|uniref:Proline iminopeptidase n=1 Tax=Niveomyces insectorum RCEF 264 TaxID=1081102 RepID=A0A167S2P5_9HYPO|nr:proline iminopeptidase [Niveomyces insectorum RCEF 264]
MSLPVVPAKLKSSFLRQQGGFAINELLFHVPLDYCQPSGPLITVTVRIVRGYSAAAAADGNDSVLRAGCGLDLDLDGADNGQPLAVYLVGGPGADNPPTARPAITRFYLNKGFHVLYMDYRGTGSSTPLRADLPPLRGRSPATQAALLRHFRQDNIVRDLEAVRYALAGSAAATATAGAGATVGRAPASAPTWTLVGQSYGGWIALTYLSFYPVALAQVFLTGGLPPVGQPAATVYRQTYRRVIAACDAFYARYPDDVQRVRDIVRFIVMVGHNAIPLPMGDSASSSSSGSDDSNTGGGGVLSAERFLGLGRMLGATDGARQLHAEIRRCWTELRTQGGFSDATLRRLDAGGCPFAERPLYAVLHEPIYAEGAGPTAWAALRIGRTLPEYWWLRTPDALTRACQRGDARFCGGTAAAAAGGGRRCRSNPAADAAAAAASWSPLYDTAQLRANTVPVAALSYEHDLFVDAGLSRATATLLGGPVQHVVRADLAHTAIKDRPEVVLPLTWGLLHPQ